MQLEEVTERGAANKRAHVKRVAMPAASRGRLAAALAAQSPLHLGDNPLLTAPEAASADESAGAPAAAAPPPPRRIPMQSAIMKEKRLALILAHARAAGFVLQSELRLLWWTAMASVRCLSFTLSRSFAAVVNGHANARLPPALCCCRSPRAVLLHVSDQIPSL